MISFAFEEADGVKVTEDFLSFHVKEAVVKHLGGALLVQVVQGIGQVCVERPYFGLKKFGEHFHLMGVDLGSVVMVSSVAEEVGQDGAVVGIVHLDLPVFSLGERNFVSYQVSFTEGVFVV